MFRRLDLHPMRVEPMPVMVVGMPVLAVHVVVPYDLNRPAADPLDHLVLVERRLDPASAIPKEAPLQALDVDLDPIDALQHPVPVHGRGQQIVREAIVDQEVVLEISELPLMSPEVRLPAIRPVLIRCQ
jgi:hypothetical protein